GDQWRRGRDLNPRHRDYPCTAFPVPHLRPLGHPSLLYCRRSACAGLRRSTVGRTTLEFFNCWRRGEDLNPRGTFWAPIRFRVGRLQPGSATPPNQSRSREVVETADTSRGPHASLPQPP